jgi:putative ABC transport system substrate-binding protein
VGGFCAPLEALAQSQPKVWRIGVLDPRPPQGPGRRDAYTNFFEGMRDLGYVEGRNITVQRLFADNDPDRLPELAAELVKQKVDVFVTHGTPAVRAAQQATSTIPIVAVSFADPVGSGFAVSLARPGGNITGVTNLSEETAPKRLELLSSVVPSVTRIAWLFNPDNPVNMRGHARLEAAARKSGKEIVRVKARAANELSAAFDQIARERVGALVVSDDSVLADHRQRIGALALKSRLPTMFAVPNAAEHGLLVYGSARAQQSRRAAVLVDKIFKGATPGDLPIEQPTSFILVVNLKIAKALGITIPQSVLLQATRVIE